MGLRGGAHGRPSFGSAEVPIHRSLVAIHRACFGQAESLVSASIPQKKHELAAAVAAMHQSEFGASDAQLCASGAPFVERLT